MSTPATVRGKTTGRYALMSLQQVYSSPVANSAADYPPLLQFRPPTTFWNDGDRRLRIEYACHMGNPGSQQPERIAC
jgi:hypothetical protein